MSDSIAIVRALTRELALVGGLLGPDYLGSGLSLGEARCLYELGQEDGATISALAERLGLDLGYVSRVVSRLVSQGLADKRAEGRDRRTRAIALSRTGRARLALLGRRANRKLGAWLDSKDPAAVARLLEGAQAFLDGPAELTLRPGRPGDVGRIIARHAEVYQTEYDYPARFEGYVVEAFASFLTDYAPPRDLILVAELGGRPVGSIALKGLTSGKAQLRFLLVDREARGRGAGMRLVQAVIDHARAQGEREIVLETASDLDAARALYQAAGFRRVRAVRGVDFLPRGVRSETWTLDL